MKTVNVDGINISPEMIDMLKMWAPDNEGDSPRPEIFVKSLGKVQDLICRHLDEFGTDEVLQVSSCLNAIVTIKDDLQQFADVWKKGGRV